MKNSMFGLVLVLFCLSVTTSSAQLYTYYTYTSPFGGYVPKSPGNPANWVKSSNLTLPSPGANNYKWYGRDNYTILANNTTWVLTYLGSPARDCLCWDADVYGWDLNAARDQVVSATWWGYCTEENVGGTGRRFQFNFSPQPDFQVGSIYNASKSGSVDSVAADSFFESSVCYGPNVNHDTLTLSNMWFGFDSLEALRITEVAIFPKSVPVDPTANHTLTAPGSWFRSIDFVDPDGFDRPLGGVHWVTSGEGLIAGQMHELTLIQTGFADSVYAYYAYDAVAGRWLCHRLVTGRIPGSPVPTLSEWGFIIFGALLLASVLFCIWRRRRPASVTT